MPSADDLFRPTSDANTEADSAITSEAEVGGQHASVPAPEDSSVAPESVASAESGGQPDGRRRPSGRVRHDEKMTVYVTSDELLDIEHARLMMRRTQGLAVDRGRLVREAVAIALADFESRGDDSEIVQRLRDA